MEIREKLIYLGAFFNSKGNNRDLIDDRIQKGRTCMVNSIAMCCEVTLGLFAIVSLILIYKCVFLAVLLYGCQVWTRLTKNEEKRLLTIQRQFLKQILHVPRSTCNSYTYLEMGILPVTAEIHIRKLTFLHHILCLDQDDPVQLTYNQQLLYVAERNWGNECNQLRELYGFEEKDNEISAMSKEAWKRKVKDRVKAKLLGDLNAEKANMKKVSSTADYESLESQEYLTKMKPEHSRILFRVRSRMTLVKEHRLFEFGEENMICRLCQREPETLGHIMNQCASLRQPVVAEGDEYSTDMRTLELVARRMVEFGEKLDVMSAENVDI